MANMHWELLLQVSYAACISSVMAEGPSFPLRKLMQTKGFRTEKIVVLSVLITAIALFGSSTAYLYVILFLMTVFYGMGSESLNVS